MYPWMWFVLGIIALAVIDNIVANILRYKREARDKRQGEGNAH